MLTFWSGRPLCRSVDFRYVASLCGAHDLYPDSSATDGSGDLIGLSIVFMENLSRNRRTNDLPEFGDTYVLDRLDNDMIEAVRAGRSRLFIDYAGEAAVDNPLILIEFHAELEAKRIPAENVILATCNRSFGRRYTAWARACEITPINVVCYDHFFYHQSGTMNVGYPDKRDDLRAQIQSRPLSTPQTGKFLCLNNMPRTHRFAVATLLIDRGHAKAGRLSFLQPLDPVYKEAIWADVNSYLYGLNVKRSAFDELVASIPILADRAPDHPRGDLAGGTGEHEMYASTRFSVVTESDVEGERIVRITEKVLKPIANGHVFINVGSKGGLGILHEHGFETFADVIDESYDTIEEGAVRFNTAMRVMLDLIEMPIDAFNRIEQATSERRLANFDRLWDKHQSYRTDPIHSELLAICRR